MDIRRCLQVGMLVVGAGTISCAFAGRGVTVGQLRELSALFDARALDHRRFCGQ